MRNKIVRQCETKVKLSPVVQTDFPFSKECMVLFVCFYRVSMGVHMFGYALVGKGGGL